MAQEFDADANPLTDIILSSMISQGKKFLDNENIIYLYQDISQYLLFHLYEDDDIDMLDFDIDSDNDCDFVSIKAKNFITGLWFSGIFPNKPKAIEKKGYYAVGDKRYTYNKKSKRLKIFTHG